jgi:hypothetical protein
MSLKVQKKTIKATSPAPSQEDLLEFAQLAFDIFTDKRHVVGVKSGQKNANRTKHPKKS